MKLRLSHEFTFNLILSGFLGLGTIISPALVFGPLGVDISAATATVLRVYGGASLGFVALMWAARPETANGDLRRAAVHAQIFHNVIGFGVTLHGVLTGVSNSLGWINVLLWLLLSLAYLYFEFLGPRSEFRASKKNMYASFTVLTLLERSPSFSRSLTPVTNLILLD